MKKIYITKLDSEYTDTISIVEHNRFPQKCNVIHKYWKDLDLPKTLPTINMYESLVLPVEKDLAKISKFPGRNGLICASGTSEWAGSSKMLTHLDPNYDTKNITMGLVNIATGMRANKLGFTDYISSDASACASSLKAIYEAQLLFNSDELDRILILGWDDQINNSTLEVFGITNASLKLKDEEAGKIPSAFDSKNGGFRIGHGMAYCLLETEESIKETKNIPIAELISSSFGGESNSNPLGISPNGYIKQIKNVLKKSGLKPEDISFIKTHGTGTTLNNKAEKEALETIFGDSFIATSYKTEIGHTMGASGLIELDIALKDAANNKIRGIKNRTEVDDVFLSKDIEKKDIDYILCLSSGMGNVFGAFIAKTNKNIRKK